ncbi:MAG: histidine kinase dimerization/phospho-acceptor domain-containing protein [Polyangiaceae bacterium]
MSAPAEPPRPTRAHAGRAWPRLGVRAKLMLLSTVLLVLAGIAGFLSLRRSVRAGLDASVRGELTVRLARARRAVEQSAAPLEASEAWDDLADDLGARADARVTIFDANERILGDSALGLDEVLAGRTDDRPEFRGALAGRETESARWSAVLKEHVTYRAAPILRDGEIRGVVRVAMPASRIAGTARALERELLVVIVIGVIVASLMCGVAGHLALRGVRALTLDARRMADGDLTIETPSKGNDEIADLGRSLEHLANGLRASMQELVGERDLLSSVLSTMREGVLILDRAGLVALINPALREMLFLGDDDVGKRPEHVIDDPRLVQLIDAAREREEGRQGEIETKGIRPRRLLARAEPLEVIGGDGGLLVVFHDVTDLRRLETLRRDFVANASHELRTPVTSIRSAAETIATIPASDPEARQRFLGVIERNAERLQRLVEDLLDLSKIESRELELHSDPVDLRATAERAAALLGDRASDARTRLVVDIADGTPEVSADARALEQVLENLLENAIKYCPGATVRVTAEVRSSGVVLIVADTGPGHRVAPLVAPLRALYRVDAGRSRALGGTGLGLDDREAPRRGDGRSGRGRERRRRGDAVFRHAAGGAEDERRARHPGPGLAGADRRVQRRSRGGGDRVAARLMRASERAQAFGRYVARKSRTASPVPIGHGRSFAIGMRLYAASSSPRWISPVAVTWYVMITWFIMKNGWTPISASTFASRPSSSFTSRTTPSSGRSPRSRKPVTSPKNFSGKLGGRTRMTSSPIWTIAATTGVGLS